jgi:hypothetical protein
MEQSMYELYNVLSLAAIINTETQGVEYVGTHAQQSSDQTGG